MHLNLTFVKSQREVDGLIFLRSAFFLYTRGIYSDLKNTLFSLDFNAASVCGWDDPHPSFRMKYFQSNTNLKGRLPLPKNWFPTRKFHWLLMKSRKIFIPQALKLRTKFPLKLLLYVCLKSKFLNVWIFWTSCTLWFLIKIILVTSENLWRKSWKL